MSRSAQTTFTSSYVASKKPLRQLKQFNKYLDMSITLSANPNERIYGFMKNHIRDFATSQGKTYHGVRRDLILGRDPDLTRRACDWIENLLKAELKSHQEQAEHYRKQIKEIQTLKKGV